jgi:hypothetical protein
MAAALAILIALGLVVALIYYAVRLAWRFVAGRLRVRGRRPS